MFNTYDPVKREEKEKHPLAGLLEDDTPENVKSQTTQSGGAQASQSSAEALGEQLLESDTAKEAAATRKKMEEEANALLASGKTQREAASQKNDALYEAILAFAAKQDSRYDDLLARIEANDYRSSAGAQQILGDYRQRAETAYKNAAGQAGGDNGGNGDTYGAALAAQERADQLSMGDAAARAYYGEQLDRILKVLQAAGGDMDALYGRTQDNVDSARLSAKDDFSLGADLLTALSDAQSDERKIEESVFSELLKKNDDTHNTAISPMELDAEFKEMLSVKDGKTPTVTPTEALIVLWKKYPDMRAYILQKYESYLTPTYSFSG